MSLQELEGRDWRSKLREEIGDGRAALLVFTPFCGTCKVAERMLEVVQATDRSIQLYKININYAPELRDEWRISSVPCLAVLEGGVPVQFEYTMRSADHLYSLLRSGQ